MKDSELRGILARHALPPVDEAVKARALDRALTALRHGGDASLEVPHRFPLRLALPLSFGIAALAIAVLGFFHQNREISSSVMQTALLEQMECLFGDRLAGVILHDGGVDLLLSEDAGVRPADKRVAVTVGAGTTGVEVLTYSGNTVCFPLGNETLCLTPSSMEPARWW
ncbi:MAG: hypothetical protein Fur0032_21990 [Terrimicrobiaceae bacterium]